jgi:RNA polymerase sigma factor (sigma-70 family)
MFGFMTSSDAVLVRQALSGRKSAFGELVERYLPMVQAVALAQTGNREDARDAAQETFLKAYLKLDTLKEPARFAPWVRTIVRNVCANLHRARHGETGHLDEAAEPAVFPDPARAELREMLLHHIHKLDENYREVLLLYYFSGQGVRRTAQMLEVSPDAVKKRLCRARAALKERIETQVDDLLDGERPTQRDARAITATVLTASAGWETSVAPTAALSTSSVLLHGGIAVMSKQTIALVAVAILIGLSFMAYKTGALPWLGAGSEEDAAQTAAATGTSEERELGDATPLGVEGVTSGDAAPLARASTAGDPSADAQDAAATITEKPQETAEDTAAAQGPTASISGTVISEQAFAVSGARVYVTVTTEEGAETLFEGVTNSDGTYAVTGVSAAGFASVFVEADGFSMQNRELGPLSPGQSLTGVDLTLYTAAGTVTGVVVTEDDTPVAGAKVLLDTIIEMELTQGGANSWSTSFKGGIFTIADVDGTFAIEIPKKGTCAFSVKAEGHSPGNFAGVLSDAKDVRFVLPAASAVTGTVLRHDGTPAAGVTVTIAGESPFESGGMPMAPMPPPQMGAAATTDETGAYRLEGLSPHSMYTIGAFDISRIDLRKSWQTRALMPAAMRAGVHVEGGQTLDGVDMTLPENPYVRLHGRVTDTATGAPARDLALGASVMPDAENPYRFLGLGRTDAQGRYEIKLALDRKTQVVISGTYVCQLGGLGAKLVRTAGDLAVPTLTLNPGDEIEVNFTVDAPLSIPVRVVDGAGQPISGINVGVGSIKDGAWQHGPGRYVTTESSGIAVCTGLPPSHTLFVYAVAASELSSPRGGQPITLAQHGPISGKPGETVSEVTLVVETKGGVEGVLTNTAGDPIANAPLSVSAGEQAINTQTRPDGGFTVVYAFAPGLYEELSLTTTGEGTAYAGTTSDVEIVADGITDLGVVIVQESGEH